MAATRIFHGKITAGQVETVRPQRAFSQARILNVDGAGPIYIRGDGVDPVAPWDDCEIIPAAVGSLTVRLSDDADGIPEVRMASPGNPAYSVKFLT